MTNGAAIKYMINRMNSYIKNTKLKIVSINIFILWINQVFADAHRILNRPASKMISYPSQGCFEDQELLQRGIRER